MLTYEIFNSFESFKQSLARPHNGLGSASSTFEGYGKKPWYGTRDMSEALNLLVKGYNDPLEKVKNIAIKNDYVSGANSSIRIPYYYGSSVNMGRAMKGLPKCMNKRKREVKNIPVINIFVDCGILSKVSVDEKIEYGIRVLSIINSLHSKGYNTEIFVGAITIKSSEDDLSACLIKIKSYAESLNLLQLCFPIVHPSFLRRLMFAWREHFPKWNYYDYGRSAYVMNYEKLEKIVNDTLGKSFIYMNYKNVDKAISRLEGK